MKAYEWGEWTFRNRSWLPVPLATLLLVLSHRSATTHGLVLSGVTIETVGEALRLWAVRHIGTISRTRADRTGPLITSGPYAFIRNPLYIGNWCLWTGVVVCSGVLWLMPIVWMVFGVQYVLITAYEERLLQQRHPGYRAYMNDVPGWIPRHWRRVVDGAPAPLAPWSGVLASERSTLAAIVVMTLLLIW